MSAERQRRRAQQQRPPQSQQSQQQQQHPEERYAGIDPRVLEYVSLKAESADAREARQAVPQHTAWRMEQLEREFSSYAPAVQQILQQQLGSAESQFMQHRQEISQSARSQEVMQQVEERQENIDAQMRTMTKGLAGVDNGVTSEQFSELLDGKSITIPGYRTSSPEQMDKRVRSMTRHLTEDGKGYDHKTFEKKLKRVSEARESGSEAFDKAVKQQFGEGVLPGRVANQLTDEWDTESMKHELQKRRGLPQDEKVTPSNDDMRRAAILEAIGEESLRSPNGMERLLPSSDGPEPIDEDYLELDREPEDVSCRGHIAQAMAAHDHGLVDREDYASDGYREPVA